MAVTYVFPTSQQITAIAQEKLPVLQMNDPIFTQFPIVSKPWVNLRWEQMDSFKGLQQLRGIGGEPNRVAKVGAKSYLMEPGAYGEFQTIDEKELLERRPLGSWDGFVNISDLVMTAQDQLLNRRINRIKWILWQLLTTGRFYVPLVTAPSTGGATPGSAGHSDQWISVTGLGQYGFQSATSAVAWDTYATATPLQDFRAIKLLARGRSVDFGPGATAYMNQSTFNHLIRNTNAADFGGKRAMNQTFSTLTSVSDVNRVFLDADLPQIAIHDDGYIDDNGVFQLYIPTGTCVVVGKRVNGDPLGNYVYTRNMVNGGEPGPYMFVNDYNAAPIRRVPPSIEVHDGHNGGPVLYYPSAIVRLTGCGS